MFRLHDFFFGIPLLSLALTLPPAARPEVEDSKKLTSCLLAAEEGGEEEERQELKDISGLLIDLGLRTSSPDLELPPMPLDLAARSVN